MIDLIEELKENQSVFVLMKTTKDFLFGEYIVSESSYRGIKKHYAKLSLKSARKKKRYFKNVFILEGFYLDFKGNQQEFLVFDSFDDVTHQFSKWLVQAPDNNHKLFKKFKKLYPQFFNFRN